MVDVFRTQTCVMVTSPGSGTSHPNTLPLGQSRRINGEEEEEVAEGEEVEKVKSSPTLVELAEQFGFRVLRDNPSFLLKWKTKPYFVSS